MNICLEKLGDGDVIDSVRFFATKNFEEHVLDIGEVGWLDVAERKRAL